ncbi:MAG: lipoyl(octanoyl) transferase LipB, partial [Actinomycetota bacterium]
IPIFRVNRGGGVTYHGPGQLVGYPIIDLRRHGRDIHLYIRKLEEVLVRTLADFGLPAAARSGLTGIWTGRGKIASIGIGVRKWITMHGFALNVACNLSYFSHIIPCGLKDVEMTTMERELGFKISMEEVKGTLARHLESILIGSKSELPAARAMSGLGEFSKATD